MWQLFAILAAVFASLTAIFAKLGLKNLDSDLAVAIRTTIVLLMAWGIVLFKGNSIQLGALSKTNWTFLILSGVATGASWVFYFKALHFGKVSQVAPIDKASLAFTLLLSALILGEPFTLKTGIAAALILCGTFILIL